MRTVSTELLELDSKDQRILAELFRNGRASFSSIAKKTRLSKDVVKYRIEKLVESEIMSNVSAIVDIKKLGWSSSMIFFRLVNWDKTRIKEFTSYLNKSPFVIEILELAGSWDFTARMYHKDLNHLNELLNNIETNFSGLIGSYSVSFLSREMGLPYNSVCGKYHVEFKEKKCETFEYDDLDLRILSALSIDGRKKLSVLEEELKENRMTIFNRIKKMLAGGLIQSFRPNMFTNLIGFHWYVISLTVSDRSKIRSITRWLENNTSVHYVIEGFGAADIIFHVQVKTARHLQEVLYSLREEFSQEIKSVEPGNVINEYKWNFFPEGLLEAISGRHRQTRRKAARGPRGVS